MNQDGCVYIESGQIPLFYKGIVELGQQRGLRCPFLHWKGLLLVRSTSGRAPHDSSIKNARHKMEAACSFESFLVAKVSIGERMRCVNIAWVVT